MQKKNVKSVKFAVHAANMKKLDAEMLKLRIESAHVEAIKMNKQFDIDRINKAHVEALIEDYERRAQRFTNKERNAVKRMSNTLKTVSTFCKSTKIDSQAFRIDEALTQFHTMRELLKLLSDMREARIKSHISFLKTNFSHTCKFVTEKRDKKDYFKFELLDK